MPKEPVTVPKPQRAEPLEPPIKDPQPYNDPIDDPSLGDPKDRPMHDPIQPGRDIPRS